MIGIAPEIEICTETVVDALYNHATRRAQSFAYGCVSSQGTLQDTLTYEELLNRAESIARELLECCDPGDRAVLLFHGGSEFIVSLFGCLIAGVIAVPAYPVRVPASATQPARNYERLIPIFADAQPKVALTTRPVLDRQPELAGKEFVFSNPKWLAIEEIKQQPIGSRPRVSASNIALLQYTSGSTSIPKGVIVSHHNLISVFIDMDLSWTHDESSVMVTWVPVFHDMGLIHGILFPLYFGFPVYSLMPASVLQQPRCWLDAISRFGGTHSSAPNFMLELCLRRIADPERKHVDLSTLRACLTGAEPVRHKTLQRFQEAFACSGLRPGSIQPGYGLAEFTLKVSGIEIGRVPRSLHLDALACERGRVVLRDIESQQTTRTFVSCGWTHVGNDIKIVDPKTCEECRPDQIGEIWVNGESRTQGYWRNIEATEATTKARMADGCGPYLRTGDLGFIVDRELYISGRLKDLIIIRGRNLYPHDIEATVEESVPEIRSSRCCAFSVDREEGEALVVVAEVDRVDRNRFNASQAFTLLREAICTRHDAELYDVVFVRTGTFPLTSSGKPQRRRARQEYLDGSLQILARLREASNSAGLPEDGAEGKAAELREWLIRYISSKLVQSIATISITVPFERMGLDSLSLAEMMAEFEELAGRPLDFKALLDHPTIDQLARYVVRSSPEPNGYLTDHVSVNGAGSNKAVQGERPSAQFCRLVQ